MDVPELPECVLSPLFVAVIVTEIGDDAEGVYDTVQTLDESVQVVGLNVPPTFPSLHDTVPMGMVWELDVSAIATVSVTCDPRIVVAVLGVIVVIVSCC